MLRPRNLIQPAVRYPADPRAVFILALSVFSGVGTLVAEQGPGTLEALMPRWGIILWAICLGLGSLMALIGLARDTDTGIVVEQIGCVMVGVATVFYSTLAVYSIGMDAIGVVPIVLAWGLACFLRWLQLQLLIHQHIEERISQQIQERFFTDEDDI